MYKELKNILTDKEKNQIDKKLKKFYKGMPDLKDRLKKAKPLFPDLSWINKREYCIPTSTSIEVKKRNNMCFDFSELIYGYSVINSALQFGFWWTPNYKGNIDSWVYSKDLDKIFKKEIRNYIFYYLELSDKDKYEFRLKNYINFYKKVINSLILLMTEKQYPMLQERINILESLLKYGVNFDNPIFTQDFFEKKKILGAYFFNYYIKKYRIINKIDVERLAEIVKNYNKIPIDYRLPQAMNFYNLFPETKRFKKILKKIKNKELLIENSNEEFLLRFATLHILLKIKNKYKVPAINIDAYFFRMAKNITFEHIPFHYCKTANY